MTQFGRQHDQEVVSPGNKPGKGTGKLLAGEEINCLTLNLES